MGLPVVKYEGKDAAGHCWGVIRDGNIYPLQAQFASHRELMDAYFESSEQFLSCLGDTPIELDTDQLLSPVSPDVQLYCQGLNYVEHREESGVSDHDHEETLMFMKAASSICAPNATILRPKGCELLDYEIELALVLRKDITEPLSISQTELPDYVGAIVLCNDVSARDFMFGAPMLQWFKGKSQRTFCPMGPVLYLMDVEDYRHLFALQLELKLNGEVKQSASTDLLIHRPAETLSQISTYADLHAGDCLLTGTPGGILAGNNLKIGMAVLLNFTNDEKRRIKFTKAQLERTRFLEPGDVLELSIRTADGAIDLGCQRNAIADA